MVEEQTGLINPSFLVANKSGSVLYVAHGDQTYVSAFSIDRESGKLTSVGQCETGGKNAVKLLLDPLEKYAIVANYTSGDVSVLPIGPSGWLSPPIHKVTLPGTPRRWARAGRQDDSHPHDLVFDATEQYLLVPDLGLDCIFVLAFDATKGSLTLPESPRLIARACSGPRHAVVQGDKPYVWVLNELDSTVSALRFDAAAGTLVQIDIVNALPGDCNVDNIAGEITYDRRTNMVHVSNRGHDSIAMFAADVTSGRLTPCGWLPTSGRGPRFMGFGPDRNHLCVATKKAAMCSSLPSAPQRAGSRGAGRRYERQVQPGSRSSLDGQNGITSASRRAGRVFDAAGIEQWGLAWRRDISSRHFCRPRRLAAADHRPLPALPHA